MPDPTPTEILADVRAALALAADVAARQSDYDTFGSALAALDSLEMETWYQAKAVLGNADDPGIPFFKTERDALEASFVEEARPVLVLRVKKGPDVAAEASE
jgi:hypothetical protein